MSSDFVKHKLFTPFMQGNNLSPGTGLGLYIVQQLVQSLDGNIDVKSERKVGTDILVCIPLGTKTRLRDTSADNSKVALSTLDPESKLLDHQVAFLLPSQAASQTARDISASNIVSSNAAVVSALTTIAEGWLGMKVSRFDDEQRGGFAARFGDLPSLIFVSSEGDPALPWTLQFRRKVPEAANSSDDTILIEKRLCHPFGPRKLAKALLHIVDPTHSESANSSPAQDHALDQSRLKASPSKAERLSVEPPRLHSDGIILENATTLPRAARHSAVLETRRTRTEPRPSWEHTRYRRLLLVDHTLINLRVLASCVKKQGCTYKQATNGQEALDMYKEDPQHIDLIFMDLSMPVMDGCTSAGRIRTHEVEMGLPRSYIVALTALGSDVSKQQAFTSGIDAFLTKPISLKDIRELLAS